LDKDFFAQQQAAVERMRRMNERSAYYVKPKNETEKKSDVKPIPQKTEKLPQGLLKGLNLPFLDNLMKDGDTALILGLLLILMSEKSDKILLFALVYILL